MVTKSGRAGTRPVPSERKSNKTLFGRLRGMAEEVGDIVSPVMPPGMWETVKEWDELNAPRAGPSRSKRKRVGRSRRS